MSRLTRRKSTPLPQYGFGDFLNKIKDPLLAAGDTFLSQVGLGNIIQEDNYNNKDFGRQVGKIANIYGKVSQAAMNVALPGSSAVTGALENSVGDPNRVATADAITANKQFLKRNMNVGQFSQGLSYAPVYACGGKLRKYPEGGPLNPEVEAMYNKFQQDVPLSEVTNNNARLFAYKQMLDAELAKRNSTLYNELNTGTKDLDTNARLAYADSLAKANPAFALSVDDQRKLLGTNYDDFNNLRQWRVQNYNKFNNNASVGGTNEASSASDTAYGARNFAMYGPATYTRSAVLNKQPVGEFTASATYDPTSQKYSYDYATKAAGGFIDYQGRGGRHEDPQGGIPVDAMGNYSAQPVAEVEKDENAYVSPEGESFVMSDRIIHSKTKGGNVKTFADKAREVHRKYKMRLDHDKITQNAFHKEMQQLGAEQESLKGPTNNTQMALGGGIDPYKQALAQSPNTYNQASNSFDPRGNELFMEPLNVEAPDYVSADPYPSNGSTTPPATPYTGSVSPVGAIATVAGNLALMARNKRNKLGNVRFNRINPEQINLESARVGVMEEGNRNFRNTLGALRNAGMRGGQYAANATMAAGDINRGVGSALSSSYLNEALENAKYRQSAQSQNAEIDMQEQMQNRYNEAEFNAAQEEYLTNALAAIPGYFKDLDAAKKSALIAGMANPNVGLVNDPTQTKASRFLQGARPKLTFRKK